MSHSENLFQGLQALANSAFPRVCKECGHKYESLDEFIAVTGDPGRHSSDSFSQSMDENGTSFLEITRLCICGSKLTGEFGDRRDTSEAGIRRRENFSKVLEFLSEKGFNQDDARDELLKLMRGEKSEALAPYLADR